MITGRLEAPATNAAPPTCAGPMRASSRVGRYPLNPRATRRKENQCASPIAAPQMMARSCGRRNPSLDLIARLAWAMKIDAGDLVAGLERIKGR